MNIIGTMYLVDEPHIDVLKNSLLTIPPPMGKLGTGTIICMDMDETDNKLEQWFPNHCQKATLLCPPPLAMYKEIDGDQEGFIKEYNEYLEYDSSVQDFIASMLLFLHMGGHILLYTPSYIDDDTIWINTLMMFFFTRYGITIGTSEANPFQYDASYDPFVADFLYSRGCMDVFDYINSSKANGYGINQRIYADLAPFCSIDDNPMELFNQMQLYRDMYNMHIYKPSIIFEK